MQNLKQLHIVIFTGGLYPDAESTTLFWKTHPQPDYVIAADSGLEACLAYKLNPCVILGDFDSISSPALLELFGDDIKVPFPKDKDYTDTELAIEKAHEIADSRNAEPFITLVGGDGGRADHFLSIFDSFSALHHPDVWLCQEQALYFLAEKRTLEVNGLKKTDVISIARTTRQYDKGQIRSEGLEWEGQLFRKSGIPSLSNRISEESAKNRLPVRLTAEGADFIVIAPHSAVVT